MTTSLTTARPGLRTAMLGSALSLGLMLAGCTSGDATETATGTPDVAASQPVANTPTTSGGSSVMQGAPLDFSELVKQVGDSVVYIEGPSNGGVSGSGMVLDTDGHILTNYHVVEGQNTLKIVLWDGTAATATVIGSDPSNDLAIILADGLSADDLVPVKLGDSDAVEVGDPVFAIGSPFGQRFSVSAGIISATGRYTTSSFSGRAIRDVLQTDAALNPGNSGGPLFNLAGEVIGINTSIENPEGRVFAGLGFAVPSNVAKQFMPEMIAGEDIQHPQLGVQVDALDEVSAQERGVSVDRGLWVSGVTAESAADRAGVRTGDVIVAVNGMQTHSFVELARAIDTADVGDPVTVTIQRGSDEIELEATLQPWDLG